MVIRLSAGPAPSRRALIFFHGFPGQPPRGQEHLYADKPRLRFEAARAAARAGFDAYLPAYPGLGGSDGSWGFLRSVESSAELAQAIAGGHDTLDVAGHSWGGLVAFNIHRALGGKAGRLALFAGLLDLRDEAFARELLPPYLANYPEILGSDAGAFERAAADLDEVRRRCNPLTLAAPMGEADLLLAHGRADTYVAVDVARRFHAKAGGRYLETDADHGFYAEMAPTVGALLEFLAAS